jgi:hypothetical protein
MKLSEGKENGVYEVTSLRDVTDEGLRCFRNRGIVVGTLLHIKEYTKYDYFLCAILSPDNEENKTGISLEDAHVIYVKEAME